MPPPSPRLAALRATTDVPAPDIMGLHDATSASHANPLATLLTVARLERTGLIRGKEDAQGRIRYRITAAGFAALGGGRSYRFD